MAYIMSKLRALATYITFSSQDKTSFDYLCSDYVES